MNCVIFGYGYMGRIRHRVLRECPEIKEIIIVDPEADSPKAGLDGVWLPRGADVPWDRIDAAFVCTLLIFDPNGLHRVDLKPGTFRSHLHLNIVPGNDILKIKPDVQSGFPLCTAAGLATSTPIQKRSLVHIPPAEGRGS
ncbi:MAG: hypothetical protein HY207_08870 [Nitrospirae bacterium]|nr:hypothetical protein [Nitrospirota bacterium]